MSKLDYNVSAKLKKLKKLATDYFLLGYGVKAVAGMLRLSPELVTTWHEDFVRSILGESPSKRIFMRELLLKNTPQMILILAKLAKNKGDEKLAASCATSVLSFASRFMQEDARIIAQEAKATSVVGKDRSLERGLFDFVDPDVDGAKSAASSEGTGNKFADEDNLDEATLAEIGRAFDMLEEGAESELSDDGDKEAPPPESGDAVHEIGLFDGIDDEVTE